MDRRDQDCYFYYYSTCLKGDECVFRHEPAALGCETICPDWQKRSCMNVHCSLRHMLLRKNRKMIPCYWENKLSGCRKPHCPFMHKYSRNRYHHQMMEPEVKEGEPQVGTSQAAMEHGEWVHGGYNQPQENAPVNAKELPAQGNQNSGNNQGNGAQGALPDPLVVSFDDGMRLY